MKTFLCASLVLCGCSGTIMLPAEPSRPGSSPQETEEAPCTLGAPGVTPIRRLTVNELQNALVDLLGVNQNWVAGVDADNPGPSGFSNDGTALTIGSLRAGQIITAVESAVGAAVASQGSPFTQCTTGQNAACARTQLEKFAGRAYRRVLAPAEVDELVTVYTANQASGFTTALSLAMERVLLSPSFLYVTAFSGERSPQGVAMSDPELATRLSTMLWSSVPDARLLSVANQGTLKDPATLEAEVKRMLADPKGARFISEFFGQWLHFSKVLNKDQIIREGMTDGLREAFNEETRQFLSALVSQDKSPAELFTADYSYVNATLAQKYGIAGVTGETFERVSLAGTHRVGVLSQGAMLAVLSNPAESRPVARGHFILEQLLCSAPPPPPDNIDTSILNGGNTAEMTVRQRLALHEQAGAACAGCHTQMDPLGLSLENFDQVGLYRTSYKSGQPVDATGTFLGQDFVDYEGMSQILVQHPQVGSCVASKVLDYALTRPVGINESCLALQLGQATRRSDATLSGLVLAIVTSASFSLNATDSHN